MAFQELERHAIDDAYFDNVENAPEITHGPGTLVLDNIQSV